MSSTLARKTIHPSHFVPRSRQPWNKIWLCLGRKSREGKKISENNCIGSKFLAPPARRRRDQQATRQTWQLARCAHDPLTLGACGLDSRTMQLRGISNTTGFVRCGVSGNLRSRITSHSIQSAFLTRVISRIHTDSKLWPPENVTSQLPPRTLFRIQRRPPTGHFQG